MIDDAIAELTPIRGSTRAACKATGRPQANHYRRHRQSPKPAKPVRARRPQPSDMAWRPDRRMTVHCRGSLAAPSADVSAKIFRRGVGSHCLCS
jgi:hypothetical protein